MERIRVKKIQSQTPDSSSCKSVIISALQFLKTVMKASFQCIRRNSIVFESDQREQENGEKNILQVGPNTVVGQGTDRLKDEEVFLKSSDEDVFESELELNKIFHFGMKQSNSTLRE